MSPAMFSALLMTTLIGLMVGSVVATLLGRDRLSHWLMVPVLVAGVLLIVAQMALMWAQALGVIQ